MNLSFNPKNLKPLTTQPSILSIKSKIFNNFNQRSYGFTATAYVKLYLKSVQ